MDGQRMYLRMRHRVLTRPGQTVYLRQLAQIIAPPDIRRFIGKLIIHQITAEDRNFIVIDVMHVISEIRKQHPTLDIETIGPPQTIIQVDMREKTLAPFYFCGVWVLLFIGAALAIMNFHADVSMQEVHQKIYTLVTGEVNEKPLILQIPYSFGLGIGMILFFNHFFKKRFNEEPSPLDVEMFNYEQDIHQYVALHENKEAESKTDGD